MAATWEPRGSRGQEPTALCPGQAGCLPWALPAELQPGSHQMALQGTITNRTRLPPEQLGSSGVAAPAPWGLSHSRGPFLMEVVLCRRAWPRRRVPGRLAPRAPALLPRRGGQSGVCKCLWSCGSHGLPGSRLCTGWSGGPGEGPLHGGAAG